MSNIKFASVPKEIRDIDMRLRELRVLMSSNPSNKLYRDEFNKLFRQKEDLKKSYRSNSDKVQNSVEFARKNNISEDRIFHNTDELKDWLRG